VHQREDDPSCMRCRHADIGAPVPSGDKGQTVAITTAPRLSVRGVVVRSSTVWCRALSILGTRGQLGSVPPVCQSGYSTRSSKPFRVAGGFEYSPMLSAATDSTTFGLISTRSGRHMNGDVSGVDAAAASQRAYPAALKNGRGKYLLPAILNVARTGRLQQGPGRRAESPFRTRTFGKRRGCV